MPAALGGAWVWVLGDPVPDVAEFALELAGDVEAGGVEDVGVIDRCTAVPSAEV